MKKQYLTNGTWFDIDQAQRFDEGRWLCPCGRWHDGQNWLSAATGSQWVHERLYRTVRGAWVLHRWSQWEGVQPSWTVITPQDAAAWLIRNGHDPAQAGLKEETEAAEV